MCGLTHTYDLWMDEFVYVWQCLRHCVWHDAFPFTKWLIHACDIAHLYMRHGSLICVRLLIWICEMTVPWLIHMYAVIHSNVWHGVLTCAPWIIRTCAMTHSYVCCDSITSVPWPIHMCDTPGFGRLSLQRDGAWCSSSAFLTMCNAVAFQYIGVCMGRAGQERDIGNCHIRLMKPISP